MVNVVYFTFRGLFADNPRAIYEGLLARGGDRRRTPGSARRRRRHSFPPGVRDRPLQHPRGGRRTGGRRRRRRQRLHLDGRGPSSPAPPTCRPGTAPRSSGSTTTSPVAGGLAGHARPGRRPLGHAALAQPGEHRAAARTRSASAARPRDRLPAQRRPEPARTATRCGPGCAPSWASPTARPPSSTPRPGATTWCSTDAGHAGLRASRSTSTPSPTGSARTTSCCCGCTAWSPAGSRSPPGSPVIDVSDRAESAELYLAADMLVTDYSSAMFDFAVTGKPMVFFTYDLEHYRDDLRGFYFDLAEVAPGPLAAHQRGTHRGDRRHRRRRLGTAQDRYARFRDTFCSLEDGHATERVLDLLFPPGDSAGRSTRKGDERADHRPSPDELSARSGPHRGATPPCIPRSRR